MYVYVFTYFFLYNDCILIACSRNISNYTLRFNIGFIITFNIRFMNYLSHNN